MSGTVKRRVRNLHLVQRRVFAWWHPLYWSQVRARVLIQACSVVHRGHRPLWLDSYPEEIRCVHDSHPQVLHRTRHSGCLYRIHRNEGRARGAILAHRGLPELGRQLQGHRGEASKTYSEERYRHQVRQERLRVVREVLRLLDSQCF